MTETLQDLEAASAQVNESKPDVLAIPSKSEEDPSARFRGPGTSFRAKLIGVDDVNESRGDRMCQDSILKLKAIVKASGQHKQKIVINITLSGIKLIDLMTAQVIHQHAVEKISFIARDQTDRRAFGYVYGLGDGKHQFFGIKTAKIAEQTVLALRDLFEVVYEMKKKEIEEAKKDVKDSSAAIESATNGRMDGSAHSQPSQGSILVMEKQLENMQEMSDMDAFKGDWSENLPTSPDTPATPGGGLDMFGQMDINSSVAKQEAYSDDLAGFNMEALEPAANGGAKLTKNQILSNFQPNYPTPRMQQQQPSMFAQQPNFGVAQQPAYGQPQQQPYAPAANPFAGGQPMGMFTPGPRPVVPARTGAMRPPTANPAQSGAPQNPFGDAFGDSNSASNALLAPVSSQPKTNGAPEKSSDPFASLVPGLGSAPADKKDMFKNFQMAAPASKDAAVSSNFDDYFKKSVGGVPLNLDSSNPPQATTNAPTPMPRSQDPFLASGNNAAPAQTQQANDPFSAFGSSTFDQALGTQQSVNNTQSLFG